MIRELLCWIQIRRVLGKIWIQWVGNRTVAEELGIERGNSLRCGGAVVSIVSCVDQPPPTQQNDYGETKFAVQALHMREFDDESVI